MNSRKLRKWKQQQAAAQAEASSSQASSSTAVETSQSRVESLASAKPSNTKKNAALMTGSEPLFYQRRRMKKPDAVMEYLTNNSNGDANSVYNSSFYTVPSYTVASESMSSLHLQSESAQNGFNHDASADMIIPVDHAPAPFKLKNDPLHQALSAEAQIAQPWNVYSLETVAAITSVVLMLLASSLYFTGGGEADKVSDKLPNIVDFDWGVDFDLAGQAQRLTLYTIGGIVVNGIPNLFYGMSLLPFFINAVVNKKWPLLAFALLSGIIAIVPETLAEWDFTSRTIPVLAPMFTAFEFLGSLPISVFGMGLGVADTFLDHVWNRNTRVRDYLYLRYEQRVRSEQRAELNRMLIPQRTPAQKYAAVGLGAIVGLALDISQWGYIWVVAKTLMKYTGMDMGSALTLSIGIFNLPPISIAFLFGGMETGEELVAIPIDTVAFLNSNDDVVMTKRDFKFMLAKLATVAPILFCGIYSNATSRELTADAPSLGALDEAVRNTVVFGTIFFNTRMCKKGADAALDWQRVAYASPEQRELEQIPANQKFILNGNTQKVEAIAARLYPEDKVNWERHTWSAYLFGNKPTPSTADIEIISDRSDHSSASAAPTQRSDQYYQSTEVDVNESKSVELPADAPTLLSTMVNKAKEQSHGSGSRFGILPDRSSRNTPLLNNSSDSETYTQSNGRSWR